MKTFRKKVNFGYFSSLISKSSRKQRFLISGLFILFAIFALRPFEIYPTQNPKKTTPDTPLSLSTPQPLVEEEPHEVYYELHKSMALEDFYQKIDEKLHIPEDLKSRVSFWFDIYAKYGEYDKIIHHVEYPWIVFDVVNTSEIENDLKLHRWTRYHKAQRMLKKRTDHIRSRLQSLAKSKRIQGNNEEEKKWIAALDKLPGSLRSQLRKAAQNVRVQTGQYDAISAGLVRSAVYREQIEDIFQSHTLPTELVSLAFLESSFNPEAVSKVGASGIWQIMPGIGKKFLKINHKVDERNDPIKASYAAAKILKENYIILRNWPLAITAYNTGPALMKKARASLKSTNKAKIIQKFKNPNYGFAASNFFSGYLAILHVEQYREFFFPQTEKVLADKGDLSSAKNKN